MNGESVPTDGVPSPGPFTTPTYMCVSTVSDFGGFGFDGFEFDGFMPKQETHEVDEKLRLLVVWSQYPQHCLPCRCALASLIAA